MDAARADATSVAPLPEALLHRIDWQVRKRLTGARAGDYRTSARGSGVDVADIRPYEPYDDPRHIDWNVTARLDEPHVREYVEDRELTAWLLLDRSASMAFGPAERGKDVVLVEVAVALTRMLTRGGNRVGAVLYDAGIEEIIPPGRSREHVLRLARRVLDEHAAAQQETDLAPLLRTAASMFHRRSLVFVVSDLIARDGWQRPLGVLAHRHEVVVLQLADPREWELPDVGQIWVQDAETGEQLLVDTSDPRFRARYLAAAQSREATVVADVRRAGAALHTVWTHEDLVEALVRITRSSRLVR